MRNARWGHLHVSPVHGVLRLAPNCPMSDATVRVRLDRQALGALSMAELVAAARLTRDSQWRIKPIVHHLAGFATEHVLELLAAIGDRRPIVWAPSASALETWRRMGFAHHSGSIVPLAHLALEFALDGRAGDEAPKPIRVAHLGGRSLIKDWTLFDRLAE